MKRLQPLIVRLLRRRRAVLAIAALAAIALVPGLLRLETDNSPDIFFVAGSEGTERYESFLETFGSDVGVRMMVEGPGLWTVDGLRWLERLEAEADSIPGVLGASGLWSHYRRNAWPPDDPDAFREQARRDPLDRGVGWVSADGSLATVLYQLEDGRARDAVEALEALATEAPAGTVTTLVGMPVLNRALDRSSREIHTRYLPFLVLFTLAILAATVRDVRDLLPPLALVGFAVLLTLGPMGYAGAELNLVLSILPPLLYVIALATVLHLMLRFRQHGATERLRVERARDTMLDKGWSVVWTGVTTAAGFASLAISRVAPVRDLGLWAAAGLVLLTLATIIVFPPLMATFGTRRPRLPKTSFEKRAGDWGETWGTMAAGSHRRLVLILAGVVALVALAGVPQIRLETDALRYLAPEHPLRQAVDRLESGEVGVASIELLIETQDGPADGSASAPAAFRSGLVVDRLADLGTELGRLDGVFGAVSAGTVVRDVARGIPTTPVNAPFRLQMALEGLEADAYGRRALDAMLDADRRTARVTLFVATLGTERTAALRERVEEAARPHFPDAILTTTGEYPLLLEAQGHLVETLFSSLLLTLLVVAVVLRMLLPSFRLAALATLPNLWPVLGVLGAMGWLGVPLDVATVMVASVVLGLAVDDTIHTLGHFRYLGPQHGCARGAALTLRATAPAYLLTGLILSAGFGVCALSNFAPISRFGGLSALAIGLAVLGDLFLLPALLSLTPDEAIDRLERRQAGAGADGDSA